MTRELFPGAFPFLRLGLEVRRMLWIALVTIMLAPPLVMFGVNLHQSLAALDKILEFEQRRYPDAWIADGRPGYGPNLRRQFARNHLMQVWTVRTPNWALHDDAALAPFREFQRLARRRWPLFFACGAAFVCAGIVLSLKTLFSN